MAKDLVLAEPLPPNAPRMSASPANTGISFGGSSILAVVMTRGNEDNPLNDIYRVVIFTAANNTLWHLAIKAVSKLSDRGHIALHEELTGIPAKRALGSQAFFATLC
ncbi:hypothetical protein R1538_34700 [Rhizobium leguminosarum]|nr:hypothetical protein [Rhizobium leguminosarum]MDV4166202.1 hypothetical protein [Rhizobium leguminosarum]